MRWLIPINHLILPQAISPGTCTTVCFILIPIMCELCGTLWPELFSVSDEEWTKYVIPPLQRKVLCKKCYADLEEIFPDGWKNIS